MLNEYQCFIIKELKLEAFIHATLGFAFSYKILAQLFPSAHAS